MADWRADFEARRQRTRARRLALNDAVDAVRARSAGKSRSEVQALLTTELDEKGQRQPSALGLDLLVDRVLAGGNVLRQVRLQARAAGIVVSSVTSAARQIRDVFELTRPFCLEGDPLFIRFDRSRPTADVILDADAQELLNPPRGPRVPDHLEVFVVLAQDGPDGEVAVCFGEDRLGMLSHADGRDFQAYLDAGRAQDRPVVSEAIQDAAADGTWALHVFRPPLGAGLSWLDNLGQAAPAWAEGRLAGSLWIPGRPGLVVCRVGGSGAERVGDAG